MVMHVFNIRAAVRIVCFVEKPAFINDALRQRHPPASVNQVAVPDPSTFNVVSVIESDIIKAIRSFRQILQQIHTAYARKICLTSSPARKHEERNFFRI